MFCPNCGTQNSETASTCTKCGFNLKGAAAPKFKGTMLMNQAPGAPAPPGMGAPPPGMAAPRPPQQPGMPPVMPVNQGLAGTVVGVPPAGLGAVASAGAPPAPPPPPGYGAPPGGQFGAPPQDPYGAPPQPGYGAPPGGQFGAPPQDPYGAPPGGQFGAPTQQGGYGAPPGGQPAFGGAAGQPGGYAPPGQPAGGVNPLGGTMAIDQMPGFNPGNAPYGAPPPGAPPAGFPPPQGGPPGGGFGAAPADPYGAPPGGQFGAPPQQQQYGAPPQQQYGAPPADPYGAPPGGQFGAPPQQPGYGAPPQQPGYGAPPGQPGYGQPGQEFQQAGAAFGAAVNGGFGAMTAPAPAAGSKPTVRNPVTQLIMAWGIYIACIIVANILAFIPIVGMFSGLLYLVGLLGYGFSFKPMIQELQAYNGNEDFKWWLVLIPVVQLYVLWLKVPEQITAAKNKAGVLQAKPTKGIVMYVFLAPWAFANDLNDIAQ